MICSPSRSHSRTLRQCLLVGHEQEVRTRLPRQAQPQTAELLYISASQSEFCRHPFVVCCVLRVVCVGDVCVLCVGEGEGRSSGGWVGGWVGVVFVVR